MLKLRQIVIDSRDARRSAEFWRQVLDLVYRPGHEPPPADADDLAGREWLNLRTRDGRPCLAVEQVDALARSTWPDAQIPQQLHLDLTVDSRADLDAEHERVTALGAALLEDRSGDEEEPLRVYADPDGHPFCIFVTPT